jgi:hypothetical protein
MDAKAVVSLAQYITGGVILAIAVWGFISKKIVPYWTYDDMSKRCEDYRTRLLTKLDPDYKPQPHP